MTKGLQEGKLSTLKQQYNVEMKHFVVRQGGDGI